MNFTLPSELRGPGFWRTPSFPARSSSTFSGVVATPGFVSSFVAVSSSSCFSKYAGFFAYAGSISFTTTLRGTYQYGRKTRCAISPPRIGVADFAAFPTTTGIVSDAFFPRSAAVHA